MTTSPLHDPLSKPAILAVVAEMARAPFDPLGIDTDVVRMSDLLERLFAQMGTEDVGELIAGAIDGDLLMPAQGRQFLGIAIWSGQTNGAQLQPTLERWLEEASDSVRVDLALAQSIFPFSSLEHMTAVLLRVGERYPAYLARCNQIVERRRQQRVW